MAELTRRRFLTYTSFGAAGAAATVVGGAALTSRMGRTPVAGAAPHTEPIVLMVRDAARGEVALMVGTTERIYRDRELVERLVDAAGRTAR